MKIENSNCVKLIWFCVGDDGIKSDIYIVKWLSFLNCHHNRRDEMKLEREQQQQKINWWKLFLSVLKIDSMFPLCQDDTHEERHWEYIRFISHSSVLFSLYIFFYLEWFFAAADSHVERNIFIACMTFQKMGLRWRMTLKFPTSDRSERRVILFDVADFKCQNKRATCVSMWLPPTNTQQQKSLYIPYGIRKLNSNL